MIETQEYTAQFKDKLFTTTYNFEDCCFEAFHFQYQNNEIYQKYCNYLKINRHTINEITDIPFLPIEFFKYHQISVHKGNWQKIYTSSGTTKNTVSKHYIYDVDYYLKNSRAIFERNYGNIENSIFLFLLPSYLERSGSSLVEMANHFINISESELSGFFLNNLVELANGLKEAQRTGQHVFLFGVSFGILNFLESEFNIPANKNLTIIETGGMKGRRKEITRQELHNQIKNHFKLDVIHSEYGMTELLSQAYSKGNGIFECNEFLKILIREIKDPLSVAKHGKGGINVIDLANIDSCCFIATSDQGSLNGNQFEILGRLDHSDSRGCNLMINQ